MILRLISKQFDYDAESSVQVDDVYSRRRGRACVPLTRGRACVYTLSIDYALKEYVVGLSRRIYPLVFRCPFPPCCRVVRVRA
jgi:hypothetical protein